MAARKRRPEVEETRRRPATTPEGRENQMVSLAIDLAEEQLRDKTASSQVITHYLKLGSTREKLEQERLISENELAKAKIEQIESQARTEELMREAISAMRTYTGSTDSGHEDEML